MSYAPVIVFTYKRPEHLQNLLSSLEQNIESKFTDLFIYIDKADNPQDKSYNDEVINTANKEWNFKSMKIVVREKNFGLKNNITSGIDEILSKYEKAIVLEEDLEVSTSFLNYMNTSLSTYKSNKKVWHISGYSQSTIYENSTSSYFGQEMNCWGWGTWHDRWENIHKNFKNNLKNLDSREIEKFNFYGLNKNNYNQILLNESNTISTWAIFWYQTIFLNGGLCLNPSRSLVKNKGFDGSGEHKSTSNFYEINKVNDNYNIKFPKNVKKSKLYENLLKFEYLRYNIKNYFLYHLKKFSKKKV